MPANPSAATTEMDSPKIAQLSKKQHSGLPCRSICRQSLDTGASPHRVMATCPHGDRAWHIQPMTPAPRTTLRIRSQNITYNLSMRNIVPCKPWLERQEAWLLSPPHSRQRQGFIIPFHFSAEEKKGANKGIYHVITSSSFTTPPPFQAPV